MVLFGGALVILVALLLSGSRGGIGSTALGLLVLGALTLRLRKQQSAEQRVAIILFGAFLVAATFLVFGDLVIGKITQEGLRDDESHRGLHDHDEIHPCGSVDSDTDTGPSLTCSQCSEINP